MADGTRPEPGHFDKTVTVTTPLKKAGVYLLSARMEGGNTSSIVLWVDDATIVSKPAAGGRIYFVADSASGRPLAGADLEFLGFKTQGYPRRVVDVSAFAEVADANGLVSVKRRLLESGYSWLAVVRTKEGRFGHLGFSSVWFGAGAPQMPDRELKPYGITDRPVYRPGQAVKFKVWMRKASYAEMDESELAQKEYTLTVQNPRGDKLLERSYTTDKYGGFDGELGLDAEASLGQYTIYATVAGTQLLVGTFRVEEYKKPEFEVSVEAPEQAVALGEKIPVAVKARYYFGAPVTDAKVKYKVERYEHASTWYPYGRWDWLYGAGYWWFGRDYEWYPGWQGWGISFKPGAARFGHGAAPELILSKEAEIGKDGVLNFEIDTSAAKQTYGERDQRYVISVEVSDRSRRTIYGGGEVIASAQPFKVYIWLENGHYRPGDTAAAAVSARTVDSKPVQGRGALLLKRISYDQSGNPSEKTVEEWHLDTDQNGEAKLQFRIPSGGQYRAVYTLTDEKGRSVEGGCLFTAMGTRIRARAFASMTWKLFPIRRSTAPAIRCGSESIRITKMRQRCFLSGRSRGSIPNRRCCA